MKALLTGSEGFIGSWVADELLLAGHSVRALVQYNSLGNVGFLDHLADHPGLEIVFGDVRDANQMLKVSQGVDAVLNLAALIAIPYSYQAPESYVEKNIKGTLNLLNAAKEVGVSRFVQTSTSEVYGTAQVVPITEDHPLQPQSPYAATKVASDALAMSYFRSFDLPVTILRPFNTFGPRQSRRAIIPTLIAQFLAGSKVIQVGSLEPRRDFTFARDTARAFLLAAEADAAIGETINLGVGFDVSVADIIEDLSVIFGSVPKIESDAQRIRPSKSEVMQLLSDNTKAERLLDWTPNLRGRAGFQRGLELTVDWWRDQGIRSEFEAKKYVI